jgi:hypothetical protein
MERAELPVQRNRMLNGRIDSQDYPVDVTTVQRAANTC